MATIYQMQILMHYHCSYAEYKNKDAPIFKETIDHLINLGLINRGPQINPHLPQGMSDPEYHGNREALAVYIKALEAIPFPVNIWVLPEQTLEDQMSQLLGRSK